MIREAELEEMEKKWREQNAAIMTAHPPASAEAEAALVGPDPGTRSDTPAPYGEAGVSEGGADLAKAP
jgi:sec-independent protein translocase protein TatB